jgi:uncharacterized protein (TIGR00730 family)
MPQPRSAQPRSVVVFCGSRPGHNPLFLQAAVELGSGLAAAGIRLIYGGGRIGLMGALADAALAAGGEVIGVIPEFLTKREVAHGALNEMIVTTSMHSRKQRMFELSDAFVMMPGGLGTLDEIIEIITWRQLGLHDRPVLICDIAGSAQPVIAAIEGVIELGFAEASARDLYEVVASPDALLARLAGLSAASDSVSAAKM